MSIASRTPEGFPFRCPFCAAENWLEFSWPPGDTLCPRCGQLVWGDEETAVLLQLCERMHIDPAKLAASEDLHHDSLDTVEMVMLLEEEFDLDLASEDVQHLRTWRDWLRYLIERSRRTREP